jgi:hypothetical protein
MRRALIISLLLIPMFGTHVTAQEGNGTISFGETVKADLNTQNQWQFEGAAGNVVSIGVNSMAFDATLELLDPQGTLLITDQDSGKNNNPLIRDFMLPTTQTYTIIVSAADGNSGEYSLTLTSSANIGCEAYDQMVFEPVDFSSAPFMGQIGQFEEFTYRTPIHWTDGDWSNRSLGEYDGRLPGTVHFYEFILRSTDIELPPCGMRQLLAIEVDNLLGGYDESIAAGFDELKQSRFVQLGQHEGALVHIGNPPDEYNTNEFAYIYVIVDDALVKLVAEFEIYGQYALPIHHWDWITPLLAVASTLSTEETPPMLEGQTIPTSPFPESNILFQDDFSDNAASWEEASDVTLSSLVYDGVYQVRYSPSSDLTYWVIAPGYSDWSQAPVMNNPYELHFEVFNVYSSSPTYAIAVLFDVTQGYETFKRLFIRNDGTWQLYRWSGQRELLGEGKLEGGAVNFEDGRVHEVVLRVDEANYTLSVDGEIKISISRIDPINGSIGFGMDSGGALDGLLYAEFDNLKVYSLE